MKTIKIKEKDISILESWNDVNFNKYIELLDLFQQKNNLIEEQFLVEFIKLITDMNEDDVMNMVDDELTDFINIFPNFNVELIEKKEPKVLEIEGNKYVVVVPTKLTIGENISIKLLEKTSKNVMESWLNLVTILTRPAVENKDELGHTYYTPAPFKGDMEVINKRKELIKTIPVSNAVWIIDSFTAGKE
jgi:hypothetical protein